METIIKDLPIPKEVIEVQEALPLPEPESGGVSVGTGIGIAAPNCATKNVITGTGILFMITF